MIHTLKLRQEYFLPVLRQEKEFEVRSTADREFRVGDYIGFNEVDDEDGSYTGRSLLARITFVLDDSSFVSKGYAVLGIKLCRVTTDPKGEHLRVMLSERLWN